MLENFHEALDFSACVAYIYAIASALGRSKNGTKATIMSTYTITAGNNSTDLGIVGRAETLLGAKRLGRKAVKTMLPNGEGNYKLHNQHAPGQWWGEERSIRTDYKWIAFS